ncbi:MAG: hypothetical protein V9G13_07975 [Marmoricola sp.]
MLPLPFGLEIGFEGAGEQALEGGLEVASDDLIVIDVEMREDGLVQFFAADLVGGQIVSVRVVEEPEAVVDPVAELLLSDFLLLDLRLCARPL